MSENSSTSGDRMSQPDPTSASENIQVFLRMRPLNERELREEASCGAWKILDSTSIALDS